MWFCFGFDHSTLRIILKHCSNEFYLLCVVFSGFYDIHHKLHFYYSFMKFSGARFHFFFFLHILHNSCQIYLLLLPLTLAMCKVIFFLFTLKTSTELGRNKGRVFGGVFDFVNLKDDMFTNLKVHHSQD